MRFSSVSRTALLGLTACLLAACGPDAGTPPPEMNGAASPAPPAAEIKTWTDITVANPADRITIHYHRQDNTYDGVGLWTWNANDEKQTPGPNELDPIGQSTYGAVFQLDRAKYAGSDKIGLIPRLGHDWKNKDGGDKFWTPALGNEVWLVAGKNEVASRQPDLSPHVEAAYVDSPKEITVSLSGQIALPARVTLKDQSGTPVALGGVYPSGATGHPAALPSKSEYLLVVVPQESLDLLNGHYRLQVDGFGAAVPLTPRGTLENRDLYFDATARLGADYTPQSTTFRLFAPTAASVTVALHDDAVGGKGRTVHALQVRAKGIWEAVVPGDLRGKFYTYLLDGPGLSPTREVLDPYATNAVAGSTRGLLAATTPPPRPGPAVASPTDMVIYEMHVRDFTAAPSSGVKQRGLYPGFAEAGTRLPGDAAIRTALDHLTELGVTHVQLLPVQDFENTDAGPGYNWGYAPTDYFSPEGAYSTNPNDDSRVREFKALVDALHARGIGVILDVVYNHTAADAPFSTTVPGYYYRRQRNGAPANGSGCGNEFRTEAPMARKLILDSLAYWAREYRVDGFRFDLMALIDQETIRQAGHDLRAINPNIVLYGEPWTASATPLQEKSDKGAVRQLPVGAFNDGFRDALKGSPDGYDAGFIQRGLNTNSLKSVLAVSGWFNAPTQSINYMTCHDNLVLWDKLKITMPGADDAALEETMKLGYFALFTTQGVPFFQGGEEFARTKGGNNNSYNAPDAVNQVDWSLKKKHLGLFAYTRDLIALRKAHPVFRLRTREDVTARLQFLNTPNDQMLAYTLEGSGVPGETWKRTFVAMNADGQASTDLPLPEGSWSLALDEHGPSPLRNLSGKINVRAKSGVVLYQQ